MVVEWVVQVLAALVALVVWCECAAGALLGAGMQTDRAKFLKRRVTAGSVEAHPTERALVVHYELEAQLLGGAGESVHADTKAHRKLIRLGGLDALTDCATLAREVVERCSLIHPSKLPEVEQLIFYLKNRREDASVTRPDSRDCQVMSPMESAQSAVLNRVDDYVELLYDDIPEKIRGSALILQLARNPDNLLELAKNEALLSALSRVLREEWKRSIELSTNIVYTFFCFSTYNEFHPVIIQYKIGSLCMDVVDYELKRYDQWKDKVDGKKKPLTPDKGELPRSRIPEPKRRPKSGTWAVADVNGLKSRMVGSSYHEDLCNADDSLVKNDEEQMKRKLKTLAKRQEQLLRVAFYLLLNIAENVKVEEKMHRKDIVGLLIGTMERHSNVDLLVLVVSFLQKLSVYVENKSNMASRGVVEKVSMLLDSPNVDLVNVSLKLLFNLTFDTKLRNKMIKVGLLPKLIKFTSDDKHMGVVMKVLYHLSMDDRVKVMFTQSDCVKLLTDMLLLNVSCESSMASSVSGGAPAELVALCVNLALCRRAAAQMVSEGRLREVVARAFRHAHVPLIKLVRNLSQHHENRPLFIEYVGDIAGAITSGDAPEDFVVECLGTLSNILSPEIDIYAVTQRYNLIPYIVTLLQPESNTACDLVLETVVLAGALCADEASASALSAAGGVAALVRLLRARQADDEHVLQTIYAFRQILAHVASAEHLVTRTEAPAYLIDLMQDKNPEIRKLCDSCLDIISQMQSDWAARIKVERFRCHNGQWLSVVEGLGAGDAGEFTGEADLPPYLSTDYLTSHQLAPSDSQTSLNNESDSLSAENELTTSRPHSRYTREAEAPDYALMSGSGMLTRSLSSVDNDSFMSADFNLLT